jgi:hypothetical protein
MALRHHTGKSGRLTQRRANYPHADCDWVRVAGLRKKMHLSQPIINRIAPSLCIILHLGEETAMKRLSILLVTFALFASPATASDRASPDDAKAMATKAAAFLKDNGPEKAFPAFQAKDSEWHDRDLYVFVEDSRGMMVSHGTNASLIGKSMLPLKDVDGKAFNVEMQAVKDTGWVEYKWQNPQTKAVEPKKAYIVRVGDYVVGVGAYVQ